MIKTQILPGGRTYTYSDTGKKILQTDTGIIYETAIDVVAHTYTETDELIGDAEEDDIDPADALDIITGVST